MRALFVIKQVPIIFGFTMAVIFQCQIYEVLKYLNLSPLFIINSVSDLTEFQDLHLCEVSATSKVNLHVVSSCLVASIICV